MFNLFLFLSLVFASTLVLGRVFERFRVPWVFASLIVGLLFSVFGGNVPEQMKLLADLGMFFLLFIIGFEIDLREMRKKGPFIFRASFFIVAVSTLLGAATIYWLFGYDPVLSFLVALSFATVGEAILVPILDEFRLMRTKLGQALIGIGVIDDIVEIASLMLAVVLIGSGDIVAAVISVSVLFFLTLLFAVFEEPLRLRRYVRKFAVPGIESLFLFVVFIFFLFLGIGNFSDSSSLAALLAGVALRALIPEKRLRIVESEVRTMCYGFFAPLFFFWVGSTIDFGYIVSYPLAVALVVAASAAGKLLGSYIIGRSEFGTRGSLMLGTGLCARFSISIVIIKILFDAGLIHRDLYSVIVASTVIFTISIPLIFSRMVAKWKV